MSLSSEMIAAAAEAQKNLAEIGGAQPGKKNALYNGAALLAVYGPPQTETVMMASGASRQRTIVNATVTRSQFTAPPISKQKWTRTDLSPAATYIIDYVGTHDSVLFTLRLVRPGE